MAAVLLYQLNTEAYEAVQCENSVVERWEVLNTGKRLFVREELSSEDGSRACILRLHTNLHNDNQRVPATTVNHFPY